MRLVSCSISEIAEKRAYSDNLKLLKDFSESGQECARVDGWTQKRAHICAGSLRASIKRYKYTKLIDVFSRYGEVYLVRLDVKKN